jgi:hypothetical protein
VDKPVSWFPVATHKFVVLSIFSFGIYDFYWFYQNWNREREHADWGRMLSYERRTSEAAVDAARKV